MHIGIFQVFPPKNYLQNTWRVNRRHDKGVQGSCDNRSATMKKIPFTHSN